MRSEALIVAQPSYAQWEPLPRAAEAAQELADGLRKHRYAVGHADLLGGSDKQGAEQALVDWLENVSEDARLVLFWTGHGSSDGGHYLVCRNSPRTGLTAFNAIDAGNLGPALANCKAEKILVILDTCYSGHGAAEIASAFSRILATRVPMPGRERAIAVIASAHPLEKASEGIFCSAFRSVLFEPNVRRLWSDEDEYIHSEFLARAVGKLLPGDVSRPEYKADGIGQDFIINPRYRPGLVAEVVEERARRLAQSGGAEHFNLAARGIEVGESGWFFAGRRTLLRALVAWLASAQRGARIVTGPPGSGKSAVMGRLATLSDPECRRAAVTAGVVPAVDDGTVPSEGIIDVAIHAKGKTLDDCARAVAMALELPSGKQIAVDVEALASAVGKLDRRVTILIDGLDEAASGQGQIIAARLISPLGRQAQVRVLVGSRRSVDGAVVPAGEERHGRLRTTFGVDAIIDDLEDEQETHKDIAEYVRLRLAASAKHHNNPAGIAATAERVADRADGVFLYGRIVSRTLQELDRLDGALPATALEAFAHDLQARFGADEQRVDDLLAALAWGEGKGLTRRVWPSIANALARGGRFYNDDDVQWVLDHAGWHVIEAGEDGQAVYRLGHQALADHYRGRYELKEAQGRIVGALTRGIAGAAWLDVDRYLWRHLADHAAQAGRLEALVGDAGYLAVADPARLVMVLPGIRDERGQAIADVYIRVVDRLIEQHSLERLPLIHMTAQMEAPDLAGLLEPPVATRWRCRWAQARRSAPHRIIGRQSAKVTSVVFGTIDGRVIVVSGGHDRTIRLWDAHTGEAIGRPLEAHTRGINSLAFGTIDGRAVVASGSDDQTIRLWDARTGVLIGKPLEGHTRGISAVALGSVGGRAVAVSGSFDGTVRVWDARTGEAIGGTLEGRSLVTSLALGLVGDRLIIVSGSHDRTIRLWDACTGEAIGKPLEGHTGTISAVALGTVSSRAVVVSGGWDSTIRIWDAFKGETIAGPLKGHTEIVNAVRLGLIDSCAVVISGSDDRTIRLWDADTGKTIGNTLEGHTGSVNAVALGVVRGRAIVASGSDDQTIRLWDTRKTETTGKPVEGLTDSINAIALGLIDDRAVVVSGSNDRTIRLWDARTGEVIGNPLEGHASSVNAVALGAVRGRPTIVSGSLDRTIRLWDARSGKAIGKPLKGHTDSVSAVALGVVNGRAVVISGSDDRTIRLWDAHPWGLFRAKQIGPPLDGHTDLISAVALGEVAGHSVVVSGSRDATIRLWEPRTGETIGRPLEGHTEIVNAVAFGTVNDRAVVVSGSDDQTIRLWDARTGEAIGNPLEARAGAVRAVALSVADGRAIVLSGTDDGTVCLWDTKAQTRLFVMRLGMPVTYVDFRFGVGLILGSSNGILALEGQLGL
jgi:WD40 repeat protein